MYGSYLLYGTALIAVLACCDCMLVRSPCLMARWPRLMCLLCCLAVLPSLSSPVFVRKKTDLCKHGHTKSDQPNITEPPRLIFHEFRTKWYFKVTLVLMSSLVGLHVCIVVDLSLCLSLSLSLVSLFPTAHRQRTSLLPTPAVYPGNAGTASPAACHRSRGW